MRHIYSLVRYVPDPAKGECVNLGLLAGSDDSSEWELRTVEQRTRARQLGSPELLPLAAQFLERLANDLEQFSESSGQMQLEIGSSDIHFSEEWLRDLANQQRGVIQFTDPQPIDALSAGTAISALWEVLINDPVPRQYSFLRKNTASGAVRSALRKVHILDENVFRGARLESAGFRALIDFAIHNGRVAYLTQCWSFQLPDKERLLDEVQSWAWTMRSLRLHGGELKTDDGAQEIDPSIPLGVVYVPPIQTADFDAFEKASRAFHDPQVNASEVVDVSEAPRIAAGALEAIGMH